MKPRQTGQLGERIAAEHLRRQGYSIVATNVRTREGELDIIAKDGETLVFVEVRARRGTGLGTPEESVDQRKREKLTMLAEAYLQSLAEQPADCRIDVVAVELGPGGTVRRVDIVKGAV